jgi:hypothetical protein
MQSYGQVELIRFTYYLVTIRDKIVEVVVGCLHCLRAVSALGPSLEAHVQLFGLRLRLCTCMRQS